MSAHFVCTLDTPKTNSRRLRSQGGGVSDPEINKPASIFELVEDRHSHSDPGSKVVERGGTGLSHGAEISGNGEDAETRAVPPDSHRTTRCESQIVTHFESGNLRHIFCVISPPFIRHFVLFCFSFFFFLPFCQVFSSYYSL